MPFHGQEKLGSSVKGWLTEAWKNLTVSWICPALNPEGRENAFHLALNHHMVKARKEKPGDSVEGI